MGETVTLVEVGPRDGLQNEARAIPTQTKLELLQRLSDCGLPVIEATSFVSPKRIPQLADADELMRLFQPRAGIRYPVLVPNMQGLERARAAGASEIAVFAAASETFSRKNTQCSIEESMQRLAPVVADARAAGWPARAYVSCVLGCPYEGDVDPGRVAEVSERLMDMGCTEISLGDTIGVGTAARARNLLMTVARVVPMHQLAVHFHDTYGQALANILACLEAGVRVVDASVAGLGGCPYAPGAGGNVATEDVIYMLHGLGFSTGVDLERLVQTGAWITDSIGRPYASKAGTALLSRRPAQ